jgi:hypothetical protein
MKDLTKRLFSQEAIADRLYKLRNKVRETSHLCYNPNCPTGKLAIKTHVLQEHGILNYAAEHNGNRNETIELRITNLNVRTETGQRYQLGKASISKSHQFTYWGFCGVCDTKLFAGIEPANGRPDYSDSRNQLLLVYRGLLNELDAKEYNIRYHLAVQEEDFPAYVKESFHGLRLEHAAGMIALQSWKGRIEEALFDSSIASPFQYIHFSLPRIPFAGSAILSSSLTPEDFYTEELEKARPGDKVTRGFAQNDLAFIHAIPTDDSLEVCLAYDQSVRMLAQIPIDQIGKLSIPDKVKLVGDLFIAQGEFWCIAPSLYKEWQRTGHDKLVLRAIHYHLPHPKKFEKVQVDLLGNMTLPNPYL